MNSHWFRLGTAVLLMPALAAAQGAPLATDPTWLSSPAYRTTSMAFGDVDRDGNLDLVCGSYQHSTALYLNTGNRISLLSSTPDWQSDLTQPDLTYAVALGDLNGDGYLDLVCGNWTQPNTVYLSSGGVFPALPSWTALQADSTRAIALGDVDGDGDLDLVCGNSGRASRLYLNDGGVFLAAPAWIADVTRDTRSIALGDVDGDGDLDLVCGNYNAPANLFRNLGSVFSTSPDVWAVSSAPTTAVALGDVNGDGALDFVRGNYNTRSSLYLNTGGSFSTSPDWQSDTVPPNRTNAVALGDVNGDGALDVTFGNQNQYATAYLNDSDGFSPVPDWYSVATNTTVCVALADVDGDGALDFATGNYNQTDRVYLNVTLPFRTRTVWATDATRRTYALAVGDVDGDFDLDIVAGTNASPYYHGRSALYRNEGGVFDDTPAWEAAEDSVATHYVVLGDVNGDGRPDLISGIFDGPNRMYLNLGDTFSTTPDWTAAAGESTVSLDLGDVDRDGDLDLVVGTLRAQQRVYLNTGGTFPPVPDGTTAASPADPTLDIALGDVNGDRDLDLVCGNADAPNTVYLNHDGGFSATPDWVAGVVNGTAGIALGDIDGNGSLDLVAGNSGGASGQSETLFLNNGGLFFTSPAWQSGPTDKTYSVTLGDVDGDGDLDLACGNDNQPDTLAQRNALYLNQGGTFTSSPGWLAEPTLHTRSAVFADLDDDGDLDLLFGNDLQSIHLYPGTRAPAFKGDPAAPTAQLPNASAFLRNVRVTTEETNAYRVRFTAFDVESDPVWIVADYQYEGAPEWFAVVVSSPESSLGPLASSPAGEEHEFTWDVSRIPLTGREIVLRLRTISHPAKAGLVQHVAAYQKRVGTMEIFHPELSVPPEPLSFPTITLGDTIQVALIISNKGNEPLVLQSILLPSPEMQMVAGGELTIPPNGELEITLFLLPRELDYLTGDITIASNDPINPLVTIPITADIRPLSISSRLLTSEPEVPLGEALTVLITPAELVRIERGNLYYRARERSPDEGDAFHFTPLAAVGENFVATVPGAAVTEGDLEYYIEVENSGVRNVDPPGAPDSLFFQAVRAPGGFTVVALPASGTNFEEGEPITVLAPLPVGAVFLDGTLHVRRGGEPAYRALPLAVAGASPAATIPDSLAGMQGLEYWVEINTLTGRLTAPAEEPEANPQRVQVALRDLREPGTRLGGLYRMVSIPLEPEAAFSGTLEAFLADQPEFGPYDPTRWRAFRYQPGTGAYQELSDGGAAAAFRPSPGKGFWLISRDANRIGTSPILGYSTRTNGAFAVTLAPGWNQIGNPFAFAVSWQSVMVDSVEAALQESVEPPRAWNAATLQYEPDDVDRLVPFEGYWIRNLTDHDVVLQVPPVEAVASADRRFEADTPFELKIAAACGGARDAGNTAGILAGASAAWDRHDRSDPPPAPGRPLSLYFPHAGWGARSGSFCVDLRAPITRESDAASGHVWRFDIAKGFQDDRRGDAVTLEFTPSGALAPDLAMWLLDRATGRMTDLRAQSRVELVLGVRSAVGEEEARYALLIGTPEFVRASEEELRESWPRTRLFPFFPNPIQGATTLRYEIRQDGMVSLQVYDVQGRRVATLVDGFRSAGRHEAVWSGEDDRGRRVAPGAYFVRLSGPQGQETRKIVVAP